MNAIPKPLVAALVASFSLMSARMAFADCTADADCKGGRVCREGQCTSLTCSSDKDCPGNLVCTQSRCTNEGPVVPPPTPAPTPAQPATTNPATPPQGAGETKAQALSGMESMVLDCSTSPNDPRCKEQKGVVLSETYVFPTPRQTFVQFAIYGGYNHGFVSGANIFSGGVDFGASFAHGLSGPLPGPKGGAYTALVAEGLVGIYGGGLVTKGSPTFGAGMVMVRPFVRFGAEFDNFGAFDSEDRSQNGLGLNVTYGLGGEYQYIDGDFSGSEFFFAHGPSAALMIGKYFPLTSKLVRAFVRVGLWNVPRASTNWLQVSGGAAFP